MTRAICIHCGAEKFGALVPCKSCGYAPKSDEDLAKSMLASDHWLPPEALAQLGGDLSRGVAVEFGPESVSKMIKVVRHSGLHKATGLGSKGDPWWVRSWHRLLGKGAETSTNGANSREPPRRKVVRNAKAIAEAGAALSKHDFASAFARFQALAEQGDTDSQRMLGVMFLAGLGVEQNSEKARKWLQAAAQQDDIKAQLFLDAMAGYGFARSLLPEGFKLGVAERQPIAAHEPTNGLPRGLPSTVGSNEPCLCGSGKTYKECHGASLERVRPAKKQPSLAEASLRHLSSGRLNEAMELARRAVQETPSDWNAHYAMGQCLTQATDFPSAESALARANELAPGRPRPQVLLALSVVHERRGQFDMSIDALRVALNIDRDYARAYNSLAWTQEMMGDYDLAAHNYEEGCKARARQVAKAMRNDEHNPRARDPEGSRNNLWAEFAFYAATYLAAKSSINSVAMPTGDMAVEDSQTHEFGGSYWRDVVDANNQPTRLYLPNYFNTFFSKLGNKTGNPIVHSNGPSHSPIYAVLMDNRGRVLRLCGDIVQADKCREEAADFAPEFRSARRHD